MGIEHTEVERHAHRNKEQAQQQTLKWIDSDFQLMPVFTFCQQDPGNKGAQRHRQAQRIHKQRGTQYQQQRRCCKDFAHA